MATFVIGGYAAGSIITSGGGAPTAGSSFMLDPNFSAATSALTFTVTDDDTQFSGSATSQLDTNQTVVVTNASGAVLASGAVRLGLASTFTQPGGGVVTLYEVWVGATLTGYVSNAQLVPGIRVTVSGQVNTPAAGPAYTAFVTPNYAPAANTLFSGGVLDDSVLGGAGNDTINADAGADFIDAGAGNDSVVAGSGNDQIFGGDGDDTIFDGTGSDTVYGGAGNDLIDDAGGFNSSTDPTLAFGDAGNDTINGTAGADTLFGGADQDSLLGDGGSDLLVGDAGSDTLVGDLGNDILFGGDGNDRLDGGADDDLLTGEGGNDTLFGGGGNDVLYGGAGADSLLGDAGNDTFLIAEGEGTDSVAGGLGTDTLDYSNTPTRAINVNFTGTGAGSHTFAGQASSGTFTEIEAVNGTAFNDTINGALAAGALQLSGGGGNDAVTGGSASDVLRGGSGNDTLTGNLGSDTLDGGTGDDNLSGGGGNDTFTLGNGDGIDTISGGTGTDFIDAVAMTGNVTLTFSATGTGTLVGGGTTANFNTVEAIRLGSGNDTVSGSAGAESVDGGAGDDRLSGGGSADTLTGGTGNDTLRGGTGADSLSGGDGNDVFLVDSGDGGDTITGGSGNDTLDASSVTTALTVNYGGTGTGNITGAAGTFTFSQLEYIVLGSGNDTVNGTSAAETVNAGGGDDRLTGNAGNDSLMGGGGVDSLFGGDGDDTLRGGSGSDVMDGGQGLDFIDYSDSSTAINVNLSTGVALGGDAQGDGLAGVDAIIGTNFDDTIIGFDGEALTGQDVYFNILFGGGGNDFIDGRDGGDSIDGGADSDTVFGGAGNDSLLGGSGDDAVFGGTGNDIVSGGDGNDTISGGDGSDTLTGGAGRDVFQLTSGAGLDLITDLDLTLVDGRATDRIDVSQMVDANGNPIDWLDVVVTADPNGNALLTFPGGEQVLLVGVTPEQVTGKQALYQIGVPCFTRGSMILTPDGERPVETIRAGDMVTTLDDGPLPVQWAGQRYLGPAQLDLRPDLRPVVIRAGAFGPHGEVTVSPQHAVLVDTKQGQRLVRARHLAELGDKRFRIARGKREVTYHHLLLPRHSLLRSNGMWSESLYPGPMALSALGPAACLDLARSVPMLAPVLAGRAVAEGVYGPTVRPVAKRREVLLVDKHDHQPA